MDIYSLWSDMVGWEKRGRTETPFLTSVLSENGARSVMNAALGDGFTTIELLRGGFNVTSNEINPRYEALARKKAAERGLSLEVTRHNWLSFSSAGKFDAVLCLGNSLCLLRSKEEIVRALREFRAALNDGGVLIADQRNFDYLLDERPLREKFNFSKNYVYCGDDVDGYPIGISDGSIAFEYRHRKHGVVGTFNMLPYRREEFIGMLREAGFSSIGWYGDYKRGNNNADFFQFVARG